VFEQATNEQHGASAGGTGGESPEVPPASSPAPSPAAADDAAKAKRAAAAKRAREARELKKLEREERAAKKLAKLRAQPSPGAAPEASPAPAEATGPEGWPSPARQAEQLPAAVMLLTQVKMALGGTRYGLALEQRQAEVPDPKTGEPRTVTVDPIGQTLAPPLAAMLASGGGNVTPSQAFVTGCALIFVPVAFFHGVEAVLTWNERRRERAERERARAEAREVAAVPAPAPSPADQPATPKPNGVALRLTKGDAEA
jgi:hypothetical protein